MHTQEAEELRGVGNAHAGIPGSDIRLASRYPVLPPGALASISRVPLADDRWVIRLLANGRACRPGSFRAFGRGRVRGATYLGGRGPGFSTLVFGWVIAEVFRAIVIVRICESDFRNEYIGQ